MEFLFREIARHASNATREAAAAICLIETLRLPAESMFSFDRLQRESNPSISMISFSRCPLTFEMKTHGAVKNNNESISYKVENILNHK
jgi:hypothetical protein